MYSFPLEETEKIIMKDLANFSFEDVHMSGALYLTEHRLVFVGYLLSLDDKFMEEIPLTHIKEIRGDKTFFFIPNVIAVSTIRDRHMKFVVKKRNQWLAQIQQQMNSF